MLLVTSAAPSRFPCPSSPGQQCLRAAINITGVVFITVALAAKLLGMLHQLVPDTSVIAVLRDRTVQFEAESRDLEETGHAIGRQILMVNVANEREFHGAFAKIA